MDADYLAELSALYEISSIPTSQVSLEELQQLVLDKATRLMGAPIALLYRWEAETRALRFWAAQGAPAAQMQDPLPESAVIARVLAEGQPVILAGAEEVQATGMLPADYPARQGICLPVRAGTSVCAVLCAFRLSDKPFPHTARTLFSALADRAGATLENIRLFAEVEQRRRELQQELAERERVEATLAEERNLLRALIDNLPDIVYVKDVESRFLLINDIHARLLGEAGVEATLGKTDYDYYPREMADGFRADDVQVMQSGAPVTREERALGADGKEIWILTTKAPLRDADGNVIGLVGIGRDLTERKQAELERERLLDELQRNVALLRSVLDATPDWIFVKDQSFRYTLVNQGYASALHLQPEDLIGKDDLELGFPEELVFGNAEKGIRGFRTDDTAVLQRGETIVNPYDPATIDGEIHVFHTFKTPLRDAEGEIVGVLGLARDITERQVLLDVLQRRSLQLQAGAEVSQVANALLELEELQQQVVDLIRERFDLYYVGLFLVDQDGHWTGAPNRWAVLRAGTGEAGYQMRQQAHKLEIGGQSMIGWCVAHAEARVAQNVGEEAVHFKNPLLPNTRSEMALPLIARARVIGALTIQSEKEGAFSNEDIAALQAMANQVAVAIENARLFEQTQAALEDARRQYEVSRRISAAEDERQMLAALQAFYPDAIRSASLHLLTRDEPTGPIVTVQTSVVATQSEETAASLTLPFDQDPLAALYRRVIDQGAAVTVQDVASGDLIPASHLAMFERLGAQSLLCLPLTSGNQTLGIVTLGLKRLHDFSPAQVRALQTLADQVAVAYQNRQLLYQTAAALEESQALFKAAQAIAQADSVADLAAAVAANAFPHLARVALDRFQYDADERLTALRTIAVAAAEGAQEVNLLTPVAGGVGLLMETDAPTLINDVAASDLLTAQERGAWLDRGIAALAAFPLSARTRRLGVMSLMHNAPHIFTPQEVRAAQTLAGQVAARLENQDLLDATLKQAQRMEKLNVFSRALSATLDTEQVFRVVSERMSKLFEVDLVSVGILSPDGKTFRIALSAGLTVAALAVGKSLPTQQTAAGQVLRTGQPSLMPDTSGSALLDEQALFNHGLRSALIAPMIAGGDTLGTLNLASREVNHFTEDDLTLLLQAASQVAVVLNNARLFEEVRQRAANEELVNRIAGQLQEHTGMEGMLHITLRELGLALGAKRARVRLRVQQEDGRNA